MADYFGDIRDGFDELYGTAASFVRLPSEAVCENRHVAFNLNLAQEQARDQFQKLCYAYEDSYDWAVLPLVWNSGVPEGIVRWMQGARICHESPIGQALEEFAGQCRSLLASR